MGNSLCGDIVWASGKCRSKAQRLSGTGDAEDSSPARARIQGELHLSGEQKEDVVWRLLFNKQSGCGWVVREGSKRFKFEALVWRQALIEIALSRCASKVAPTRSRSVSHQIPPLGLVVVVRGHSICNVRTP